MKTRSLRQDLITWLLALCVLVALSAGYWTYSSVGRAVNAFMDRQMEQLAQSHAATGAPLRAFPQLAPSDVEQGAFVAQVWDRSGRLVTSSAPTLEVARQKADGFHDVELVGASWRAYTVLSPDRTIQIVQSAAFREHVARRQAVLITLPVSVVLSLAAVLVWLGVGSLVQRIQALTRNAEGPVDLPLGRTPSELQPLAAAVTALKARVREPLTLAIKAPTLQEVAPAAPAPASVAPVRVDELLQQIVAAHVARAEARRIDLAFAASIRAEVAIEADELRMVVGALLDNALRYTADEGVVDVALHRDHGMLDLEVIDNGPGLTPAQLDEVMDEDSGRGLVRARQVAERCGVELQLVRRVDGPGLIARLRFAESIVIAAHRAPADSLAWRPAEALRSSAAAPLA